MSIALAKYFKTTTNQITIMIDLVDSEAEQLYSLFGDAIYDMIKDGEVSDKCVSLFNANTDMEKVKHFKKYMHVPV